MSDDEMAKLSAFSPQELREKLSRVPIRAKGKKGKRTNEVIERHHMYRFLSTIADENLLTYPLEVVKQERPDYRIECEGKTVGVEISYLTNPHYQRANDYKRRAYPDNPVPLLGTWFPNPQEKMSTDTMRAIVAASQNPNGHKRVPEHCSDEERWRTLILNRLEEKTKKLVDYDRSDENWLLLDDDLSNPQPTFDVADEAINALFKEYYADVARLLFDQVLIVSMGDYLGINATGMRLRKACVDVWNC